MKILLVSLLVVNCVVPSAAQTEGPAAAARFFQQNCSSCHTIGGGTLIGPDLKNVTQRKDKAWLVKFLQDPAAMMHSGDPYALQLKQNAHGIVMPTVNGMTPALAEALLDMIQSKSEAAPSPSASAPASEPAFTARDAANGKALFMGRRPLQNGGPACVSCHSVNGVGGLGGGDLGPDLTDAYTRLGERKGLRAWLSNPPSPTMQPIFKRHPLNPKEIFTLMAFFEKTSQQTKEGRREGTLSFFLLGFGGAAFGLLFLGTVWKRRVRGVRQALVHRAKSRNGGKR